MTGVPGGTIIIVQQTLSVVGTLSVNGLGGKGAAAALAANTNSPAAGGGGAWGRGGNTAQGQGDYVQNVQGFYTPLGMTAGDVAYARAPIMQSYMANGGQYNTTADGGAGGAYPLSDQSYNWMQDRNLTPPLDWLLWRALLQLIEEGQGVDHASYGAIGGGGGGGGAVNNTTSTPNPMPGGRYGGAGIFNTVASQYVGSSGGSGIGGGGAGGGGGQAFPGTPIAGPGGRGGGVLLVLCGTLRDAGVISADGIAGGNASSGIASGGGGGGGGGVCVGYHIAGATTPTIRANGGTAGALISTGKNGGAGGAGVASSFRISTAIASTI